jgi:hypothetical protein
MNAPAEINFDANSGLRFSVCPYGSIRKQRVPLDIRRLEENFMARIAIHPGEHLAEQLEALEMSALLGSTARTCSTSATVSFRWPRAQSVYA